MRTGNWGAVDGENALLGGGEPLSQKLQHHCFLTATPGISADSESPG